MAAKKILIIRFSSIGDIILTTPIIRAVKLQLQAEVHFLTKQNFGALLANNPYIDRIWTIEKKVDEHKQALKAIQFDQIIDLHKNLRSKAVKRMINAPYLSFDKINVEKWLVVNTPINRLPDKHIVDRYFECVRSLGIKNDQQGLDFILPADHETTLDQLKKRYKIQDEFICIAVGATFATKRMPNDLIIDSINQLKKPCVLIGGPNEKKDAAYIASQTSGINTVGELSIDESAILIHATQCLLTPDTGMMHIAAALNTPQVTVWGNTIPSFGMYPYQDKSRYAIIEKANLACRPCSKLGHHACPKKHFKCMKDLNSTTIIEGINRFIDN